MHYNLYGVLATNEVFHIVDERTDATSLGKPGCLNKSVHYAQARIVRVPLPRSFALAYSFLFVRCMFISFINTFYLSRFFASSPNSMTF